MSQGNIPLSEVFRSGLAVIPDGTDTAVFQVDRLGNTFVSGGLNVAGSLTLSGGSSFSETLANNEFLAGLTTSGTVKRLIGVNTSNQVAIDVDAAGAVFAGQILSTSGTAAAPGISFSASLDMGLVRASSTEMDFIIAGTAVGGVLTGRLSVASTTQIDWSGDTILVRDAANILALKNGPTAQELRVYGTTTGPKYASVLHDGSNAYFSTNNGSAILQSASVNLIWNGSALYGTDATLDLGIGASNRFRSGFIQSVLFGEGGDLASANTLTLGNTAQFYSITGTTAIQMVTTTGYAVGNMVLLKFAAAATVAHNTTATGLTATILTASAGTYTARPNDIVALFLTSSSTVPKWVLAPFTA